MESGFIIAKSNVFYILMDVIMPMGFPQNKMKKAHCLLYKFYSLASYCCYLIGYNGKQKKLLK